jgi:hypothetical protein
MNPNKFHAIRALHVFRNVVEELATHCAMPLHGHAQRKVGLILLESAADVAHAAYALYEDADSQERRDEFEAVLRKADALHSAHVDVEYRPYHILLETLAALSQPLDASFVGAGALPDDDQEDSVESAAWQALKVLLADVDQTVAYGLAADVEPVEMLLIFVSLQLPAALVHCAFEALDGDDEDGFDVADAIDKYNALREDAYQIRNGLALPLTVHAYPAMPTLIF